MRKQKLTAAEKVEKKRRKAMFETVFINGKQKRVRRYQPDNLAGGHLIGDPIYLKQNEMWPELYEWDLKPQSPDKLEDRTTEEDPDDLELPF